MNRPRLVRPDEGSPRPERELEDLKYGGGGPYDTDMEQRVRSLENDTAYFKGRLDDMPTKDWVTTRLFWVVAAIVSATGLIAGVQVWIEQIISAAP